MQSKQGKAQFLKQLEDMNAGLNKNLATKRKNLEKAANKASDAHRSHQLLVEEHRKYHSAVKDFHEECQKNEAISARIAELAQ